ncbi:hypothetical protein ACHAXA_005279 [Cyclostephanos tholiformis]|uniref:glycerol-3-phosphate dehydrogenase n=1 Tax=Cyclostephanos tholiformis TaxID=382380 RepID=A0ABD3RFT6_9STRA
MLLSPARRVRTRPSIVVLVRRHPAARRSVCLGDTGHHGGGDDWHFPLVGPAFLAALAAAVDVDRRRRDSSSSSSSSSPPSYLARCEGTPRSSSSSSPAAPPNASSARLTRRMTIRHDGNYADLISDGKRVGDPFPLAPTWNREVMGPHGIPSRAEQVRRLKSRGMGTTTNGGGGATPPNLPPSTIVPYYDVLVIGGGATGAGIAFDAVTRTDAVTGEPSSLNVACIERGDFSSETSSRSTKLIWAGIKYLASASAALISWDLLTNPMRTINDFYGEFMMVFNCHQERRYMLEKQSHLTNWIPIVCPFTEWHIWPPPFGHWLFSFFPILAPAVFKFYDGLSGFTCPPSYVMGPSSSRIKFPQLNEKDIKYCAVFYEGQHNDARTNIAIALSAAERGADIANYVEMTSAIFDEDGRISGVRALDRVTGEAFEIRARNVIFAGGPFTDALRQKEDGTSRPVAPSVSGASGTHIVLPGYYAPPDMGLLDYNTSDGRFLFFLPWQGSVIVGTTDKKGPAETLPYPPEEEIQWMLKECEKYLSRDLKVRRSDVLSAWRGWRPLASDPNAPPGGQISRDHVISTNPRTGTTFVAGGKWTTWREMAQDVLDGVLGKGRTRCNTLDIVLHGGEGYSKSLSIQLIQKYGLTPDVAEHLVRTYGGRVWELLANAKPTGKQWPRYGHKLVSNYPYIEEEVRYACREYACTIEDILSRRTRLAFLNSEAALEALPRVADIMAEELGWSRKVKRVQIEAARAYLESYGGRVPVEDDLTVRLPTLGDAKDIFREMDRDRSGRISIKEIKDFAQRLGQPLEEERVKAIFESMDKDRDGKVNAEDFMEWFSNDETKKGIRDYFRQKTIQIFKEIDIDNTGYLDERKIKDISIQLGHHLPDKKIKAIFKEMDVNKSGKVDVEHFIAWMDKDIDKTGFRKMLSASMGLGGTGWLDSKAGSFLG